MRYGLNTLAHKYTYTHRVRRAPAYALAAVRAAHAAATPTRSRARRARHRARCVLYTTSLYHRSAHESTRETTSLSGAGALLS
jgi:hypothetical protein